MNSSSVSASYERPPRSDRVPVGWQTRPKYFSPVHRKGERVVQVTRFKCLILRNVVRVSTRTGKKQNRLRISIVTYSVAGIRSIECSVCHVPGTEVKVTD